MEPFVNEAQQYQTPNASTLFPSALDSWLETKRVANAASIQAMRLRTKAEVLKHRNVVVVDDEPTVAVTLAEILAKHGVNAVWFTDPGEALKFIGKAKVDLLLSDINMPQLDGVSLSKSVHKIQPTCFLFLFSATADDPAVLDRIKSIGLPVYLEAKPLHPRRLMQAVQTILSASALIVE